MSKRLSHVVAPLLISLSFPVTTLAWNAVGHMAVADVAYQHLTPAARRTVDDLMGYFRKEYPQVDSFTLLASWPDAIRSQKIDCFSRWHYIDTPFTDDGSVIPETLISADNATWALKSIEAPLKNTHANPYERARFLAFYIHIVGDLHQPMHTVTRVSHEHPNGDKGGNQYALTFGKSRNLHHLWDNGMGTLQCSGSMTACAHDVAQKAQALYPQTSFGRQASDLEPKSWSQEGFNIAKTVAYQTPEHKTPSNAYIVNGEKVIQQEIALAGYRLANLLNKILA